LKKTDRKVFKIPRKTKTFECDELLAIVIPKQYAAKIGLQKGDTVSISLNSLKGLRFEKV
jgi:bifunctional DNA-binding transcriptional regulator/antitoxin component of YhaV-PrlF toxin-antitoxin module